MHSLLMQIVLESYWGPVYQASTLRHTPCASWNAAVAQMVEHVIRNDGVEGSSPFSGTSNFNGLAQALGDYLRGLFCWGVPQGIPFEGAGTLKQFLALVSDLRPFLC